MPLLSAQVIIAFSFGVTFVVALIVLAIRFPHPTPFQYNVFRIVLSLAAAGAAAMIPGFINIDFGPMTRLFIGAGGALAVFVIVFFFNPAQLASPSEPQKRDQVPEPNDQDPIVFKYAEETVTCEEKLRTLGRDVVKVNAYTPELGIRAERDWIRLRYPGSKEINQSLISLDMSEGSDENDQNQIYFDVIRVILEDGRRKEVYFDITSFFGGEYSPSANPDAAFTKKLTELYRIER